MKSATGDRFSVDARRAELGDFLRSRRAELTPESVGLPRNTRRRTPGLRREDVAELAGISVTLYTWLEQGRDVAVSVRTVDAIAHALQCTDGERLHALRLVQQTFEEFREELTPGLRRMVSSLPLHPILVLNHAWDIVLLNAAALAVYGDAPRDPSRAPNLLEYLFLDPRARERFVDRERAMQSMLEIFRLDFALHPDDLRALETIEYLQERSPEFVSAWRRHRVRAYPQGTQALAHPEAGRLLLEPTLYTVTESPSLRLLILTPCDDETVKKLKELIAAHEFAQKQEV